MGVNNRLLFMNNKLLFSGNFYMGQSRDGGPCQSSPIRKTLTPLVFLVLCQNSFMQKDKTFRLLVSSMGQCFVYALISLWRFSQ